MHSIFAVQGDMLFGGSGSEIINWVGYRLSVEDTPVNIFVIPEGGNYGLLMTDLNDPNYDILMKMERHKNNTGKEAL